MPTCSLPHPRAARDQGAPRSRRLPKLAQRLVDPATHWQPHTVALWYGRTNRRAEIATGTGACDPPVRPPLLIRWLLVRDPTGELDTHAFLATDLDVTPQDMLQWFVLRW